MTINNIAHNVKYLGVDTFQINNQLPESTQGCSSTSGNLVNTLTQRLYTTYYCQQTTGTVIPKPDNDMLQLLQHANNSSELISNKWMVTKVINNNQHIISRNNFIRSVTLNEIVTDGSEIKQGTYVSIKKPYEDFTSQNGFYYFIGDTLGHNYKDLETTRIYLNIELTHAVQWVEEITRNLNFYQIPFHGKILRYKSSYNRVDRCILYVPRIYINQILSIVIAIKEEIGEMGAETPLLTYKVQNGIGIADNPPNGESFGMHRMAIVAEGITRAWHMKQYAPDQIINSIHNEFVYRNIDIQKPWLNDGNSDYDFIVNKYSISNKNNQSIYLEVAQKIANTIVRDAIWDGDKCSWIDWNPVSIKSKDQRTKSTLSHTLYDGTAGISLLMAYMYVETQNPVYKSVAIAAYNNAINNISNIRNIGLYSGLSGILYTQSILNHLGIIETNISDTEEIINNIENMQINEYDVDIISGRAGAINCLIFISKIMPALSDKAISVAQKIANQLIILTKYDSNDNCFWDISIENKETTLLGFSHGVGGIATSLYKLYLITHNELYKFIAIKGIKYEISHFNETNLNWPDWRNGKDNDKNSFMCAWCHGAPGTNLALSYFIGEIDDIDKIINLSTKTIINNINNDYHYNFCACHGTAGNADIIKNIAKVTNNPDLEQYAITALGNGINQYHDTFTWPTSSPDNGYNLGLLTGISGIAYTYLRQHNPKIPSILDVS